MELHVNAWASTDVGRVRPHNEDDYLLEEDLQLFAVADGMGGHQRGEVASALACDVLREHIRARKGLLRDYMVSPTPSSAAAVERALQEGFIRACEEIYQASSTLSPDSQARMGTTLDAVLIVGEVAFTAHVGDGRIYIVRSSEAHQVTEDHSLVQEQVRAGLLTADQAKRSRHRNVITRALGAFPSVLVDTLQLKLGRGDRLLLCSDGLHGFIQDTELGQLLSDMSGDQAADHLVTLAHDRGSRDNITGLIISLDSGEAPADGPVFAPAEHVEILRRCDLFSACTYRELVRISAACERRRYSAGQIIVEQDSRGRECFIIATGEVAILRDGVELAKMGPSGFFGELSFLDEPRRSASVKAAVDTRVLVISRRAFLALLRQESALGNKLLWRLIIRLSQLVRATNAQLLEQVTVIDTDDLELIDFDVNDVIDDLSQPAPAVEVEE